MASSPCYPVRWLAHSGVVAVVQLPITNVEFDAPQPLFRERVDHIIEPVITVEQVEITGDLLLELHRPHSLLSEFPLMRARGELCSENATPAGARGNSWEPKKEWVVTYKVLGLHHRYKPNHYGND